MWAHEAKKTKGLIDYKFYCFNGAPKYLYISQGLEDDDTANISFLNTDWSPAEFGRGDYKPFTDLPAKPRNFSQMIKLCQTLSQETCDFIRADLYEINQRVYFSELTFFPCSGMMPFVQ